MICIQKINYCIPSYVWEYYTSDKGIPVGRISKVIRYKQYIHRLFSKEIKIIQRLLVLILFLNPMLTSTMHNHSSYGYNRLDPVMRGQVVLVICMKLLQHIQ